MTKFLNIDTDNSLGGSSASDVLVASQKAVKDYVDAHSGGLPTQTGHAGEFLTTDGSVASWSGAIGYHPGLFAHEWDDHLRNDVQWLRANTFSWQDGSVYKAAYRELLQDMYIKALWGTGGSTAYTRYRLPAVGQMAYSDIGLTTELGQITETDGKTYIVVNNITRSYNAGVIDSYNETIAGTTISYALSTTGRKVVFSQDESKVAAIYNATGAAWYYIVDTANQRFKLPRSKHNKFATTLSVVGTGLTLGLTDGTENFGLMNSINTTISTTGASYFYGKNVGTAYQAPQQGSDKSFGVTTDPTKSGIVAQQEQDTNQYKYLYFYVGNFTQTAIENTAGLNTEMFNDLNAHKIIAVQEATAANGYTWYRKYADGWVEQGCLNCNLPAQYANTGACATLSMPIVMAGNDYHTTWAKTGDGGNTMALVQLAVNRQTTYCEVWFYSTVQTSGASIIDISVSGKAA